MKEIERAKTTQWFQVIRYNWWRPDGKDIEPEHVEMLTEAAENIINYSDRDNGHLHQYLGLDDNSEAIIKYEGGWEISYCPASDDLSDFEWENQDETI